MADIIYDTHTFCGRAPEWDIPDNTYTYFQNENFSQTRFLVIPFNPAKNQALIDTVQTEPRFAGCYLIFNPNPHHPLIPFTEYDYPATLEKLAQQPYVVGIKTIPTITLVPLDSPLHYHYYELAEQLQLPFLMHFSSTDTEYTSVKRLEKVYMQFPHLILIGAHMGGVHPDYIRELGELAQDIPGLYLNTTCIDPEHKKQQVSNKTLQRHNAQNDYTREEILKAFLEVADRVPEKILVGSDLGYYTPKEYSLWPIPLLGKELQNKILRENPRKLFTRMKEY